MSTNPAYPIENLHLHPRADEVPPMTEDEYDALYADVVERGIVEPIEALPDGTVLDGRHRYAVAQALGLDEVPVRFIQPADPFDFMLRAALIRRHLTIAQRKALAASLLIEHPERSDRQVAAQTRLDHKTVAAVRDEGEGRGDIPHVETRTDTLGRHQPEPPTKEEIARARVARDAAYDRNFPGWRDEEAARATELAWDESWSLMRREARRHKPADVVPLLSADDQDDLRYAVAEVQAFLDATTEAMKANEGLRVVKGGRA